MRAALYVVAALLVLTGVVWMGQGLGYIKGSFMTGEMQWFWIGVAALLAGFGLAAAVRLRNA